MSCCAYCLFIAIVSILLMHKMHKPLSSASEHCFFGYYDLTAWSDDGDCHLAHGVDRVDRIPRADDVARVGFIRSGSPEFIQIGETTAWNFQQGAMLQWLQGGLRDHVVFNIREDKGYRAAIYTAGGRCVRTLPLPVANVDPLGRFALSINFSRMLDFRPGYGYAGIADPFASEAQPAEDGIFSFTLDGSSPRCVLSLRDLGELCRPYFGDKKLLVNHLNLNPTGTRFIALVRHFPDSPDGPFSTLAITANADGSEPYVLWSGGVASHYHWRDAQTVSMVIKDPQERITLAEFRDRSTDYRLVDPAFFLDDGHQSYSPDRTLLLYDSYPIEGKRYLYLYDLVKEQGRTLAVVDSQMIDSPVALETRCDLHPRWHPSGKRISFDSVHEGHRGIYVLDL